VTPETGRSGAAFGVRLMRVAGKSRYDPEMGGFVEAWDEIETEHALLSVIKATGWLEDALEFDRKRS